jgi:hypothetical protein
MEHKLSATAKLMLTRRQMKSGEDLSDSYYRENGKRIAFEEALIYEETREMVKKKIDDMKRKMER